MLNEGKACEHLRRALLISLTESLQQFEMTHSRTPLSCVEVLITDDDGNEVATCSVGYALMMLVDDLDSDGDTNDWHTACHAKVRSI